MTTDDRFTTYVDAHRDLAATRAAIFSPLSTDDTEKEN